MRVGMRMGSKKAGMQQKDRVTGMKNDIRRQGKEM
jgi:hypothetical protein